MPDQNRVAPRDVLVDLDMDRLPHVVIYKQPHDHPDHFVARLWYALPEPEIVDAMPWLYTDKDHLFRDWWYLGAFLNRHQDDDPNILGVILL